MSTLLNISQVANFLQVTVRTVYRMIESGEFPRGHMVRGSQRWFYNEIEDFIRFSKPIQKNGVSNSDT